MTVADLECHKLTRDAREYAKRVLEHGPESAVLWYNKHQSALFRRLVQKELEKYGVKAS